MTPRWVSRSFGIFLAPKSSLKIPKGRSLPFIRTKISLKLYREMRMPAGFPSTKARYVNCGMIANFRSFARKVEFVVGEGHEVRIVLPCIVVQFLGDRDFLRVILHVHGTEHDALVFSDEVDDAVQFFRELDIVRRHQKGEVVLLLVESVGIVELRVILRDCREPESWECPGNRSIMFRGCGSSWD